MTILEKLKQFFAHSNFYRCPQCGYTLPKKDAKISGYNSQSSLRHIHCPKCGKIIKHVP